MCYDFPSGGFMSILKSKIIKVYGDGVANKAAVELGISHQRLHGWPEILNKSHVDGVIAALVRRQHKEEKMEKYFEIPLWLLR